MVRTALQRTPFCRATFALARRRRSRDASASESACPSAAIKPVLARTTVSVPPDWHAAGHARRVHAQPHELSQRGGTRARRGSRCRDDLSSYRHDRPRLRCNHRHCCACGSGSTRRGQRGTGSGERNP